MVVSHLNMDCHEKKGPGDAALHLKIPALLVNGDYEPVDVRDELITLSFPQSVCTLLQKLH